MYQDIRFKRVKEGIYKITLNRPEVLNAVSKTMATEVIEVLDHLKQLDDCRVLILSGEGRSFTVGADTTAAVEMEEEEYNHYLTTFREMLTKIEQFPAPVVAMLDGFAFGGGAEVSCVCDLRIGCEEAQFRFPGVSYGLVVSASSLSTIVSLPKAKELMFSSAIIDAKEAFRIGILNQLVTKEELENYVYEYAEKVAKNQQLPVEKTKEVLNQSIGKTKTIRKEIEAQANDFLRKNTNQRETFASFTSKRKTNRNW
jgi:enoyl-CoA hydratase